jgi:uncharacterized protein (DUF433 family)
MRPSPTRRSPIAASAALTDEPWKARLNVPNYPIGEAARYARVTPARVRSWHSIRGNSSRMFPQREARAPLSYLQLIEVAVVGAFTEAGLKLKAIREARDYFATKLGSTYPFAEYRFKTDGKDLVADLDQVIGPQGADRLLNANKGGQIEWAAIIGELLREFDYEGELAIRWRVGGKGSPVVIDPRISFGAPSVKGKPTWVVRDKWRAGEAINYIARDLRLKAPDVEAALVFEGEDITAPRSHPWLN